MNTYIIIIIFKSRREAETETVQLWFRSDHSADNNKPDCEYDFVMSRTPLEVVLSIYRIKAGRS